jgi:hypothetical protein
MGSSNKRKRGTAEGVGLPGYLAGKSQRLIDSTDIVLVVQGKDFPVHSAVLAAGCKFFDDLFNDSSVEAEAGGRA